MLFSTLASSCVLALPMQLPAAQDAASKAPVAQEVPTIEVHGRVTGPLGQSISDATVWYSSTKHPGRNGVARVDENGVYKIRAPGDHMFRVSAVAPGHCSMSTWVLPSGRKKAIADVRLWAGATIRGRVVDADGEPVEGVEVTGSPATGRSFGLEPIDRTRSSSDGGFVLEHVPLGPVQVRGYKAGFVMAQTDVQLKADADVSVILKKGDARRVSVLVRDAEGQPVEGCSVTVHPYERGRHQSLPSSLVRGRTDAKGRWEAAGYAASFDLRVSVSREGYVSSPRRIEVDGERDANANPLQVIMRRQGRGGRESGEGLEFTVKPMFSRTKLLLRGRVVDESGDPVARVKVECRARGSRQGSFATTGPDGHFVVNSPVAAGNTVRFYLRDTDRAVDVPASRLGSRRVAYSSSTATADANHVIRTIRGVRISGRAVTDTGLPVKNQRVAVANHNSNRMPLWLPFAHGRTDARGRFDFRALHPANDVVRVQLSGALGAGRSEALKPGAEGRIEGVEVVVPSPGKVVGRVVDAKGKGVPGARVKLMKFDPKTGRQVDGSVLEVLADAEGRFAHLDVASGGYKAIAHVTADMASPMRSLLNDKVFVVVSGREVELRLTID